MTPLEMQATLVTAKLAMVRYRNALRYIRDVASQQGLSELERVAALALRERPVGAVDGA